MYVAVGSLPRLITVTVVSDLPGRGGTGDDCLVFGTSVPCA